jgi:hypothetical protein
MDVAIVASGHQHQVYPRWIMGVRDSREKDRPKTVRGTERGVVPEEAEAGHVTA